MSCTDYVDAPLARGVPERDVWTDPAALADGIAGLNRDLAGTGWRAWLSDAGRVWVSRALHDSGAVPGKPWLFTGCGDAHDADNPRAMRLLLIQLGVLEPGPEWLTPAEAGEVLGVNASTVNEWARKGRFAEGVAVLMGHRMRYRADGIHAMRRQMESAAA